MRGLVHIVTIQGLNIQGQDKKEDKEEDEGQDEGNYLYIIDLTNFNTNGGSSVLVTCSNNKQMSHSFRGNAMSLKSSEMVRSLS